MRPAVQDDESVIRYLLGESEVAERDRIEERLFMDPGFVDSVEATEQDLLHKYLRGDLKAPWIFSFERIYMAGGPRSQRLADARALRDAVRMVTLEREVAGFTKHTGRLKAAMAVAASLAVIGVGSFLLTRGHGGSGMAKPMAPLAILDLTPALVRSEGAQGYAVMRAPADPGVVRLRMALPESAPGNEVALRAVLGTPERPGIWSGPVVRDGSAAAHVEVQARLLARGDYRISIASSAGPAAVATYVFRVD